MATPARSTEPAERGKLADMNATDLFEAAVDAVVSGDEARLKALLAAHPNLVRARSARPHKATLLHYVAANGVEDGRQTTPPNAVAIARRLLEAGADANARAEFYGRRAATLGLLVSSVHPHTAGLQGQLAELLLDFGAAMTDEGHASVLVTALAFGYMTTAQRLAGRGAAIDVVAAAGLGRLDRLERMLPNATPEERYRAVVLAAIHGQTAALIRLLDAGEDPNRFNPEGFHSHSTPLHQAVWFGHEDTVRALVARGARTDIPDKVHGGTALGWAEHGGRDAIARFLRPLSP